MTTDTERVVRAITVTPEFFQDQPEAVGRLLADQMKKTPAHRWVIVVGPAGSAEEMMDRLFMYGPAEESLTP